MVNFAGTYAREQEKDYGCTALRIRVQRWKYKGVNQPVPEEGGGEEIGVPPLEGGDCQDDDSFAQVDLDFDSLGIKTSLSSFSEIYSPGSQSELARLDYSANVYQEGRELKVNYRVDLVLEGWVVETREDRMTWKCEN